MTDRSASRSLDDPAVREIIALRRRRYVPLSVIVCAVYGAVALACAFAPGLMRRPIAAGSHISIGIAGMVLIIIVGIACSGYYTWWSNTVRDPLLARVSKTASGSDA